MEFRAIINLTMCMHAGQHNPVWRCMLDPKHSSLLAGMENLSIQLPKPAGFHNYIARSFIVLTGLELVFTEEPEISSQAFLLHS